MMYNSPFYHSSSYSNRSNYYPPAYPFPKPMMEDYPFRRRKEEEWKQKTREERREPKREPKQEPKREQKKEEPNIEEEQFFEIFGIRLYFDDILLVCLLFFLYQEGVKDEGLFISLILLLLS